MDKMDSVTRLRQQSRRDRSSLVAGIAIVASLTLLVFFAVGSNAPSMAVAMGILAPVVAAAFACAGFLGLRLVAKMERDSFDEGMYVVMESAPMVCSLYDKDSNIKYCNDAAPKLFGFRDRQEYTKNYKSSFPEFQPDGSHTADKEAKAIHDVMSTGSANVDWYQKSASGELLPSQSHT